MLKLLKLKVWITIVLLSCFTNLYASNTHEIADISSTGELVELKDSVLISYDDLRLANSKLLELEYERKINNNLRNIIYNDSIIIRDYKKINNKISEDCKKTINQRNIAIGFSVLFFITSIVLFVK